MKQKDDPLPVSFQTFRNRTTHWRIEGSVYFITWRLYTAQPELTPEERLLVKQALLHFNDQRYRLYAYVVMNDHVHVIAQPLGKYDLSSILHSWKSFTAHEFQRKYQRVGQVWQKDGFDRVIRDEEELFETAAYILNNPAKRWPELKDYVCVGWFPW